MFRYLCVAILEAFIRRFEQIDEVVIKLLRTNSEEIDNDDFWSALGERKDNMNSSTATVRFANSKEGLDADSVFEQASSAANLGNSEVNFRGHDIQGDSIKGNNDDFSLSVELVELSKDIKKAANDVYAQFNKLAQEKIIALPPLAQTVVNQIGNIIGRL